MRSLQTNESVRQKMAERVSVLPVHEDRVASIEVEAILVVGIHKAGIKENNEVVVLV